MLNRWNEKLRNNRLLVAGALIVFTFILYRGALKGTFVYDDEAQILTNPFVLNAHLWTKLFTGTVWSFNSAAARDNYYRPLYIFSYWLVYRVAGANPVPFHIFQILLYAATAWLVYRLGCELFHQESVALAGTVLWVLHPLHVEAVAWIGGMADVGWGGFVLLSFLLFVRAEKGPSPGVKAHLIPALAYFPALFFKELALVFPLLLVTYWLFLSPPSSASRMRDWLGRCARLSPYITAVVIYFAIRMSVVRHFGQTQSLLKVSGQNVLAAVALLGEHARIFFWPIGLNPGRSFDLYSSLGTLWPWVALLLLFVVVWFRKRMPVVAFLVFWWLVTMLPCLDIRQLAFPKVSDRYAYVPSMGLCLALPLLMMELLPASIRWSQLLKRILVPALATLAVFWAALTVLDIPHWRSEESMMVNVAAHSPDAPWPHLGKGDMLRFQAGDLDGAEREYRTALRLSLTSEAKAPQVTYDSYMGLGGVAQERRQDALALAFFQRAADLLPQLSPAYDAMGAYYFPRKDYLTASHYFVKAVRANPQDVVAHVYLGNCWMKLGQFKDAVVEFHAARTVDPTLKQVYISEARALEALGDSADAARVLASYH